MQSMEFDDSTCTSSHYNKPNHAEGGTKSIRLINNAHPICLYASVGRDCLGSTKQIDISGSESHKAENPLHRVTDKIQRRMS